MRDGQVKRVVWKEGDAHNDDLLAGRANFLVDAYSMPKL